LAEKALEVTRAEAERRRAEIPRTRRPRRRGSVRSAIDEVRIARSAISKRCRSPSARLRKPRYGREEVERARITTERGIERPG
jgi:hypothetical protein